MEVATAPSQTSTAIPLIDDDSPISRSDEDLLDRKRFAEHVAQAFLRREGLPGIVVGLNGPWGNGKSSVKTMIVESWKNSSANLHVVEFNPWQYESHEQLTREFFTEIAVGISPKTDTAEAKKRRAKLMKYASRIVNVGGMTASAVLTLGGPFGGIAATSIARNVPKLSKALEEGSAALSEQAAPTSLSELKKELAKDLKKLETPVVIVVDDIDRLDDAEIKLLFRLVKANADFPNVNYLLLFARDRVERALKGEADEGHRFLEKIITVSFDLPALTRETVVKLYKAKRKELTDRPFVQKRLSTERLDRLDECAARPYLDTLRAAKRYLNMLHFMVHLYSEETGFNVNFVDLASLEFLRTFEPEVYKQLPHMKEMLTDGGSMYFLARGIEDEPRRQMFLNLVKSARDSGREPFVQQILSLLFPQVNWFTGDWADSKQSFESRLRSLRVDTSAFYSRYFGFTPRLGLMTEGQFQSLIGKLSDIEQTVESLRSYEDEQLYQVFQLLIARSDEIATKDVATIMESVFIWGETHFSGWIEANEMIGHSIDSAWIELLLGRIPIAERMILIRDTAERTKCFAEALALVHGEHARRESKKKTEELFLDDDFSELQAWSLEYVRELARGDRLTTSPHFRSYLHYWGWSAGLPETQEWINGLHGKLDHVRLFALRIAGVRLTDETETLDAQWRLDRSYVSDIVALESDINALIEDEIARLAGLRIASSDDPISYTLIPPSERTLFYLTMCQIRIQSDKESKTKPSAGSDNDELPDSTAGQKR